MQWHANSRTFSQSTKKKSFERQKEPNRTKETIII